MPQHSQLIDSILFHVKILHLEVMIYGKLFQNFAFPYHGQ